MTCIKFNKCSRLNRGFAVQLKEKYKQKLIDLEVKIQMSKSDSIHGNKKIIETAIWEKHPDKPILVNLVGRRKVFDVYNELVDVLKANDMMPDEYLSLNSSYTEKSEMPTYANFYAYAYWGGSEGVYLDVWMVYNGGIDRFVTGKTLGETEADFDRMQMIAGFIHKTFTGFGRDPE